MKKSNVIVFVLLALASAFFLWLWYFLGLNRVDSTAASRLGITV